MKTSHLLTLSSEARISPEDLGSSLGISGMTLRRWMKRPPSAPIPKFYHRAFADEIVRLWMEGRLKEDSGAVQWAMKVGQNLSFQAAIKNLGLSEISSAAPGSDSDKLMVGLTQIGSNGHHRQQVDGNKLRILSFSKMSKEWGQRISALMKVVRSNRIDAMDKLVAYGALFYLLCPFDLIPDNIPVFGLLDDYVILGLAASYYAKRLSRRTLVP
jgi:uncharacterized membrane protein YkvA (DUF1232 family)